MVSKARLDLPEPESPVTTIKRSRGNSSDTFLRLWTRAPCTAMVVRGAALTAGGRVLPGIEPFGSAEESEFVHINVARAGQTNRERSFADDSQIGQVFAGSGYA